MLLLSQIFQKRAFCCLGLVLSVVIACYGQLGFANPGARQSNPTTPPNGTPNHALMPGRTPIDGTVRERQSYASKPPVGLGPTLNDLPEDLRARVASLEAGRQDLSAWAAILIGVMTLLLAANVGLSVWQAGSIARREAGTVIEEFDRRFDGFLSTSEETIRNAVIQHDQRLRDLTGRVSELMLEVQRVPSRAQEAIGEIEGAAKDAVRMYEEEGKRLKARLENQLRDYHSSQMQELEERLSRKAPPQGV